MEISVTHHHDIISRLVLRSDDKVSHSALEISQISMVFTTELGYFFLENYVMIDLPAPILLLLKQEAGP